MLDAQTKPYALVHSYGFSDSENDGVIPDARGRLQILAALELLRLEKIEKIIFTGGTIDESKPPIAEVMAKHARQILPDRSQDILSMPSAHDTVEEIQTFKTMTEENHWEPLMIIASEAHLERVMRIVEREFNAAYVPVYSAEQIIQSLPDDQKRLYKTAIWKLRSSTDETSLRRQEKILNRIDTIPILGPLLIKISTRLLSSKKAVVQTKVLKKL